MRNKKENQHFHIVFIALMTAVISVLSPFSIPLPFSPVPLSFTTLIVYLSIYAIGPKCTFFSCLLYLLLGLIGIPVFSGFTGGFGKLLGPTGGYLIGYLFIPLTSTFFFTVKTTPQTAFRVQLLRGMNFVLGTFCCYLLGTIWLSFQTHTSFSGAFLAGVAPFIPGDICKIALALFVGPLLRSRLQKANII